MGTSKLQENLPQFFLNTGQKTTGHVNQFTFRLNFKLKHLRSFWSKLYSHCKVHL